LDSPAAGHPAAPWSVFLGESMLRFFRMCGTWFRRGSVSLALVAGLFAGSSACGQAAWSVLSDVAETTLPAKNVRFDYVTHVNHAFACRIRMGRSHRTTLRGHGDHQHAHRAGGRSSSHSEGGDNPDGEFRPRGGRHRPEEEIRQQCRRTARRVPLRWRRS